MILGHWVDEVWADGTWVPETWGVFVAPPPPPVVPGTGPSAKDRARAQALYEWRERQRGGEPIMAAPEIPVERGAKVKVELPAPHDEAADEEDIIMIYILGGFDG